MHPAVWLPAEPCCRKGHDAQDQGKNPTANIVAIDYDPGATAINQENRIKLMIANARRMKKMVQYNELVDMEPEMKETVSEA